jgi:heme/copper-type cytochrome/quinol oxidase subunit 4
MMVLVDGRSDPTGPDRQERRLSPEAERSARRFTGGVLAVLLTVALVVRAQTLDMSPLQTVLSVLGVAAIGAVVVWVAYMFSRLLP